MSDHEKFGLNMKQEEKSLNDTLFNEIISTYNDPHHLMHKKLKQLLNYVKPGDALIDVGCGIGEFIVRLKDRLNTLIGIDISRHEIEFAKNRAASSQNIFFSCGELDSFHFPDERFDVCLCLDVLEHVTHPCLVLQEINRILKRRGSLIVTVPNWYDIIVSKVLRQNPLHIHTFTPWRWMNILRRGGFKIELCRAVDFPVLRSDFLARKIYFLGMWILIIAVR